MFALRHMVSDKSQVRSTGQVMAMTRQPVKGNYAYNIYKYIAMNCFHISISIIVLMGFTFYLLILNRS